MPLHPLRTRESPLVIGHRGAPGHRPEHTESSYRVAFASGVDAVEPDVVVSRDGVLVVRHENEIGGTTDVADRSEFADRRTQKRVDGDRVEGWFTEDFTWEELATLRAKERLPQIRPENTRFDGREPILRLRDVLALVDEEQSRSGRRVVVVVEVKHPHFFGTVGYDLAELLLAELRACGWEDRHDQLVFECFELGVLDRLRAESPNVPVVFLLEHDGAPADAPAAESYEGYRSDAGLDSLVGRVDGISPAKRDILADVDPRSGLVARAHARDFAVFTWTLRPENRFLDHAHRRGKDPAAWGDWRREWRRIVSTGVDGVFLDHPELFRDVA